MADTLESLEIEVKHSASGAADEITRVAEAVGKLGSSLKGVPEAVSKLAKALSAIGDKGGTFNITDNSTRQYADTINNVKQAASKAKSATTQAAKGIREMSSAAQKSKSPLDNFVSSLKRIAFYRFIRSIIKSITQAFQEGLQNAYAFSQGIATEGHRFAAALDSMSTAGLKMKNQLGSAFIALLTALAPIINAIISLITRLANALSQLFAVFTGGTYLKAADVPKQWGEAAGGAAKAAKEWRNQLLGFDEINRLEEPNDPNGSGGGGALDPMSMFEDTPIDGIFKKMRDKLIELKESLNFEPLIESWNRLKESVKALGETILSGLAWAWENILVPLAHWTIEQLAPTLVNLLASAFDFLRAVLEALAPVFDWLWQNIMKPLFEFIGTVAIDALSGLNKLLKDLADLISGEISFVEFIKGLTGSEYAIGLVVAILGGMGLIGLLKELDMFIRTSLFLSIGKLNTLFAFFAANPAVAVVAAIAAIIFVCIELVQHWEEIKQKLSELKDKFASTWGDGKIQAADFAYAVVVSLQTIIGWIETAIGWVKSLISWLRGLDSMSISPNVSAAIANDRFTGGNYYASGGHPSEGEIFVARESGPEMVGMMGGRTTVATNADIVEGIRQGVFEAVSAAMNGGQNDVNVRVYLDSREIKVGQNRLNRAMGVG